MATLKQQLADKARTEGFAEMGVCRPDAVPDHEHH